MSFLGTLSVVLGLDTAQYQDGAKRAAAENRNFQASLAPLTKALGAIGVAFSLGKLGQMADQWSDLKSRVDLATGSQEAGAAVMERLRDVANATYSDIGSTVESWLANATALKDLGLSTRDSLDYTEALNNALVVSGAKGQQAASVQDALSKAMAIGKLSGDQLNTVLARGGRVAELLAQELGTTVSGLRKMGADGKITADVIQRSLIGNMERLRDEAGEMPATIADGFQRISTNLMALVGKYDQATGASAQFAGVLISIADNLQTVMLSAGALAGMIGGRFALAFVVARGGILSAVGALVSFRTALMSTGIGAVAVAIGYATSKTMEFADEVGGLANVFEIARTAANEAMDNIGDLLVALGRKVAAITLDIQRFFANAWASAAEGLAKLLDNIEISTKQMGIVGFLAARAGYELSYNVGKHAGDTLRGVAAEVRNITAVTQDWSDALQTSANAGLGVIFSGTREIYQRTAAETRDAKDAALAAAGELNAAMAAVNDATGGVGSGGGSGGRSRNRDEVSLQRELEQLYEATRTSAEKYAAELERLNELKAAGLIDQDLYNRAVEQLGEKYRDAADGALSLQDVLKSVGQTGRRQFTSLVTGATSFADALDNVVSNLANMLGQLAVNSATNAAAATGWGQAVGAFFGVGANAAGTPNWRGGLTMVGENGPELANLPKGTQIYNAAKTRDILGGGGASARIGISLSPDLEARILDQARGQAIEVTRAGLGDFSARALPARVAAIQRDGRRAY